MLINITYFQLLSAGFFSMGSVYWGVALVFILFLTAICLGLANEWWFKRGRFSVLKINMAKGNIRLYNYAKMILKHTNSSVWRIENGNIYLEHSVLPSIYGQNYIIPVDDVMPKAMPFYREELLRILHTTEPGEYQLPFQVYEENFGVHWLEMHMKVKKTRDGIEKVGVFINIDDVKNQEAELLEAHRRILNSQERDNFIDHMNHEIRTPLNAIVGFSQLLCEKDNDDLTEKDYKLFSDIIENNNNLIVKLIEDMLTLAHLRYANVHLNLEEISLKEMSMEMSSRFIPIVEAANLKALTFADGADVCVRTDKKVILQIVNSIIDNAIKFNKPGGSVAATCGIEDEIPFIRVSDTGIGIAPEDQPLIFKRFYKVDTFSQGTGLGLALAKEYAQKLGCRLDVKSQLGTGSVFTLYFNRESLV